MDETAEFIADMSFEVFEQDRKTINAVVRSLEVLGEAAKKIPDDLRSQAPSVPWRRMAGMRDKLIHEYFGVDLSIVWVVVTEELPPLRPDIVRLVQGLGIEEQQGRG
jgi:uncharacterized protein with HEPN domain